MKILLVEDEALIAMMAEDMIEALGHSIVSIAPNIAAAQTAIEAGGFDAVLLDVNLNGDNSMALASLLKAKADVFAFTTGYGSSGIDQLHQNVRVLTKPYSIGDLEELLAYFSSQGAGTSSTMSVSDSNRG